MTFINEYIPEEDFEKYKLKEIDSHFHPSSKSRQWTVDRGRDIYLRRLSRGREEYAHESWWSFYWHGELLSLQLDVLRAGGEPDKPAWTDWSLRRIAVFNDHKLPEHLKEKLPEIVSDLKAALTAYKDGGVFSQSTSYSAKLDVDLINHPISLGNTKLGLAL